MSKIAFFCIPAHGHTNPTLAVVRELIDRGNEVWYYSYDAMKSKIEETGARYISCDPYDIQMKLSKEDTQRVVTDIAFATELIVETTLAMDQAIYEQMQKWNPACIVADSMAFWGKLVAAKLGVPFVSSTTTFAFNRYSSKYIKQNTQGLFQTIVAMGKANKIIKKLRGHGYPVKNVLSIIANDNQTNTIVYTSSQFQPYAETFSDKYTFVGPSIQEKAGADKLSGKAIYISLGTVLNNNDIFYRRCLEAFANQEFDVIISSGEEFDISSLGELPANIKIHKKVDQIKVLQQVDAFITHCGMNSVNEALYYKVPLILYPQTPEQGAVAHRVHELGAGIYLKDNSVQALVESVEEILHNPSYAEKAEMIGDGFHQCGGAKLAADTILALAKI